MGYVPADAKWYLAEIVLEIKVKDDPRNVVHTNQILVRADSPEEAFEKAIALGEEWAGVSYLNPYGKRVEHVFRGLHDLRVIMDELEHGCEIAYREDVGVTEDDLQAWVSKKEDLSVFAPREPSNGPDYTSGEVMEKLNTFLRGKER